MTSLLLALLLPSSALAASGSECAAAPGAPLSLWHLDGDGTDAAGLNDATEMGAVGWTAGITGGAADFDRSDYLEAGTTGLPVGAADRTLALWVRVDDYAGQESFMAGWGAFGDHYAVYVLGAYEEGIFFSQWGDALWGPAIPVGEWHHLAATNEGHLATLYLDGVAVGSQWIYIETAADETFNLGGLPDDAWRRFDGQLDEVVVYDRALGADEIADLYGCGVANAETCDGLDNDGDGTVDQDPAFGGTTWSFDGDGDTFGAWDGIYYCDAPDGTVADDTDCDDGDALVHPGAEEVLGNGVDDDCDGWPAAGAEEYCNGLDDDDDGLVDEDALDTPTWYADLDADGLGSPYDEVVRCEWPSGYVDNDWDCDDFDATVTWAAWWYTDADADGWGTWPGEYVCAQPAGTVDNDWDCDDGDAAVYPWAEEVCADGIDQDCDGIDHYGDYYALDQDGDGWGASDWNPYCEAPEGAVDDWSDCDDANPGISPGAEEICGNDVDENCDGSWDYGSGWYADDDHDGYGDPAVYAQACEQPEAYVANADDCDPADPRVPGVHDCPEEHGIGSLYSTSSRTSWVHASWGGNGEDDCSYTYAEIRAVDSWSHTVADPSVSTPGAPNTRTWVTGWSYAVNYCTWSWSYAAGRSDDARLSGSGAHTNLVATLDWYDYATGERSTVDVDLTWTATGPASWRDEWAYSYAEDGSLFRYSYGGTGRNGTVTGTFGGLELSDVTGTSVGEHDGYFEVWTY